MPRNGSGTYNRVPGSAYTNGTVNDGSELDAEMNDIATALTASLTADGQKPLAANLAMAGFKLTGLGSGSAAGDSVSFGQAQAQAYSWLTSVSGTNTITATATPAISAYAAGQTFRFVPANTNTGAVTINISGVGAIAVTKGGATALSSGDLVAGTAYQITHDGTQFQVSAAFSTDAETQSGSSRTIAVTPASLASRTATDARTGIVELATTAEVIAGTDTARAITPASFAEAKINLQTAVSASGTAVDFSSIPSTAKRVTIGFHNLSLNSNAALVFQLGDSGGIESSGYLGSGSSTSSSATATPYASGFLMLVGDPSYVLSGAIVFTKIDSTTWAAVGSAGYSTIGATVTTAGSKSLSSALTQIRMTTSSGTDTFDSGTVSISYE